MESVMDTAQSKARDAKDYANGQINNFMDSVEDLTKSLKDVETPEIARLRAKVKMALVAAKSAISDGAAQVGTQARQVSKTTDTYVRDNPWQVVGIAALVGLAVGILASRRGD
jgi:ElaB/YqjD/DUF883 family membrane-anchored ribosome-binding protein